MFFRNLRYSKVVDFVVFLLMVIIYQSIIFRGVEISGISLDLSLIILVYVGLTRGPVFAALFGFASGLLLDVYTPGFLGLATLLRTSLGFLVGNFRKKLFLETLYSKGGMIFFVLLGHDLFYYLFATSFQIGATTYILLFDSLPSALYTTVVGMVIFGLIQRRLTQIGQVTEL
jgi:rod shape-determining protein MreD